jgi:membrane protein implicated in regulation of membrane protease activity
MQHELAAKAVGLGFAGLGGLCSAMLGGGVLAVATDDVTLLGIPLAPLEKLTLVMVLALVAVLGAVVARYLFKRYDEANQARIEDLQNREVAALKVIEGNTAALKDVATATTQHSASLHAHTDAVKELSFRVQALEKQ